MGPVALASSRRDWRLVFFYILAFASGGVIRPFLNIYLVEIGLTGTQIGMLQGGTALVTVVFTPLIGILADRTQRHRLFLGAILFTKGISSALLPLSNVLSWVAVHFGLRVITAEAQDAIGNQLTLAKINREPGLQLGRIRAWGMGAYALTVFITGLLARGRSASVLFWVAGVMCTAGLFTMGTFPAHLEEKPPGVRRNRPERSPQFRFMLLVIFLYALARSGVEAFVNVYFVQEFGMDNDFIGLTNAVSASVPIVAYYIADWLVERYGPVMTMVASFGCFAASWGGYLFLDSPWPALVLVSLQGFGFAFYVIGMVILVGRLGMAARGATDQMLAQLTVPGLAMFLIQPVSGWIFDNFGGRVLFMLDAAIILAAAGLLLWRRDWLR